MLRNGPSTIGVFSRGIMRIPHLAAMLGARRLVFKPSSRQAGTLDGVAGWGCKPNTERARAYAARHGLPYLALEDGFLRSLELGVKGAPPLSLVLDDQGMYYDATRPSRLENLLNEETPFDTATLDQAGRAMARIREERLSKYNAAPDLPDDAFPENGRERVLVVDQTFGDMSVVRGLADAGAFERMLAAALVEQEAAEVWVKVHPDTLSGSKRGYLAGMKLPDRVRVLDRDVNPISLLSCFDHVYTVSSQMGFEALLLGLPVTCFGLPFYAGWGVTDDRKACPRRRRKRSVTEIFAAAYLIYARYIDPATGAPCDISRVIDHLALARRMNEANRGTTVCFGFRLWKRSHVRPFVSGTDSRVIFARDLRNARRKGARPGCRIVVWGQRAPPGLDRFAAELGAPIGRLEDGFIRSVGLGSDLNRACSLVVDWQGIYYDPRQASDLEVLLQTAAFPPELLERAARLRRRILECRISKYNVGTMRTPLARETGGRRAILVPGQVEDDASIRLGTRDIATNSQLIEIVRRENPDAHILYKPHPDVVARNRRGRIANKAAEPLCDEIVVDASIDDCIGHVDAVHTMTSLAGFEALLRGRAVVTYGAPFYAGWGLTVDRIPIPRRSRRLTLNELVAGVLILYPRYYDWRSGAFCECETIVERLAKQRSADPSQGRQLGWRLQKTRNLVEGWLRA